MKNKEIANIFNKVAEILELKGELVFKINAYRKAARIIEDLSEDINEIYKRKELSKIPGIGSGLEKKIIEYIETGKMTKYEEVKQGISNSLIELLEIPGLGPKTLNLLYKKLNIVDLDSLIKVLKDGTATELFGMGKKKVENILKSIEFKGAANKRISIKIASDIAEKIINYLKRKKIITQIEPAGSLRRKKETIGDIDILATGKDLKRIIEEFINFPETKQVLLQGDTKASIRTHDNLQVDLRVVDEHCFGSALQYFTGSKPHNIKLREIAKKKNLKISEYGIFKGDNKIGGKQEIDLYSKLNMDWIPPELREDRGEIGAAQNHQLPELVTEKDIKGDLHIHSNYSDGHSPIEDIVQYAIKLNYKFIAISDHSKSLKIASGLSIGKLLQQIEEIKKLNKKYKNIHIFSASEVDIDNDGSLDYPNKILNQLDFVIAAIHKGFKQDQKTLTMRILKAMDNPKVKIIAHPTGILLSERPAYNINLNEIFKKAATSGIALEINAYYDRLDLNDINCKKAKEYGCKLAIGTDAHYIEQMDYIKFGLGIARRGWLEKSDVINTFSIIKLKKILNIN